MVAVRRNNGRMSSRATATPPDVFGAAPMKKLGVSGETSARAHCNDFYDQSAAYRERTFLRGRPPLFDSFMESLPTGAKIIDVGSGAGRDLAELKAAGYECEGVDLSPSLARYAANRSGARVHVGDFRSLAIPDGEFDGAIAIASLLHLLRSEFHPALGNIRRWLRPGGFFLATMKVGTGEIFDETGRRFTLVEPDEWLNFLRTAGFLLVSKQVTLSDQSVSSTGHRWIATLAIKNG